MPLPPRAPAAWTIFALVLGAAAAAEPPASWVDPDTGHRVIRLTREPGSDSFYFNVNGYTPDGRRMVYTTPAGISVLDLATLQARQVVQGRTGRLGGLRAVVVGRKAPDIYYTRTGADRFSSSLWRTNLDTGRAEKLADLPRRAGIDTVNADETLAAGTYVEGDAQAGGAYDRSGRAYGHLSDTNMGEPFDKGAMMMRRIKARLPMTLYTVDLATGKARVLMEHQTDWLNHLQFSPADPTLLMYCHEGPWWLVDRIWTIRTDGTGNRLVHRRTMEREIAGHEWWSADGETIWYQLHFLYGTSAPPYAQVSYVAGANLLTGQRIWYSYAPEEGSIHDNSSPDGKLFCGDGGRNSPWIFLFRPVKVTSGDTLGKGLIQGGYFQSEKLVNMSKHNYRLEPNPSFTPDEKFIVFRSNMFGPDYAFAVELAKAKP